MRGVFSKNSRSIGQPLFYYGKVLTLPAAALFLSLEQFHFEIALAAAGADARAE